MNLILHIGISKTGTTSLQKWLSVHFQDAHSGVFYPGSVDLPGTIEGNHRGLVMFSGAELAWSEQLGRNIRNQLPKALRDLSKEEFQERFMIALRQSIKTGKESGAKYMVLSNEHLSERPTNNDLDFFSDSLDGLFETRKIVLYLREQCAAYQSLYGETLKHGSVKTFQNFIHDDSVVRLFDYHGLIERWRERGWEVEPRIYHERGGNSGKWKLIEDFAHNVLPKSSKDNQFDTEKRANLSLSSNMFSLKRLINQTHLNRVIPLHRQRRALSFLSRLRRKDAFRLAQGEQFKWIFARHEAGNAQVARHFFNRENLF
ncbi:MAG: hypothetical protein P1U90_07570 [Akkermansiaceae bacterium]|nr:hypothetical protein [Akkermansiaceae bacterium]